MATRKPTSTGRGGTRGTTSKKTAGKARKSAASASRKLETASASRSAAKTAMKAATVKKAAKATAKSAQRRDVAKALTGTPKTAKAVQHNLESSVRGGTATKGQSAAYRATHTAARQQSAIYGTAKRTANAVTKSTTPKVTNTAKAVRKPKPAAASQSAAKKTLTSTAVRKKKPLY